MDEAECKAIIEEGTAHRGWITNSYAQIEFLLGDLIVRSREFPQYNVHNQTVSHSAAKRIAKIRSMLNIDGPFAGFAEDLLPVLDQFEDNQGLRNLLAHGFCTFYHTPSGDAGFEFRKFERPPPDAANLDHVQIKQTFRLIDLDYHRAQLVNQAQTALKVFRKIHQACGWEEA